MGRHGMQARAVLVLKRYGTVRLGTWAVMTRNPSSVLSSQRGEPAVEHMTVM